FSEDPGNSFVWTSNAGDVVVSGGTLSNISGTGLTRTATFTPTANVASGTANLEVSAGTYTDAAGNIGNAGTSPSLTYSTTTPTVTQVGLSSATGAISNFLNAGDLVFAKVVFSEAIVLNATGGSPTLSLMIGSSLVQATYSSGSGTTDFVFSYTILEGQDDANGISIPSAALSLNGSTLKSVIGNSVTLGNASVANNILYPVDTTAPSVLITSSASNLKVGESSLICFTFTEDPGTSFSLTDVTVTGGNLSTLTGFGNVRRSTFTPTANLASGTASITVTDSSYTDVAGNLGTAGTTPSISFDTLAPSVSSVALSGSTGALNHTLNAGDTLNVTAAFNDVITVNTNGGSPTLALLVGASTVQATYVSGSGTNALVFTTTIVSGQTDADGVALPANALTLSGATLKDANGNSSSITSTAVSSNANYLVDTTAPSVVIASNKSSLNSSDVATITFTFSEDPGTSFAWDGSTGDVVIAGGSLGAISGTGMVRTAVFTPASNQGSGTASITVESNSYQDAAGNKGAPGLTPALNLDTLAPTVTRLALTSSTGGMVSALDATVNHLNAGDTLSATVTFNDVITVNSTSGTPTLALNVGGTAVQAIYASGSGSNALVFTATVASGQNDANGVALGADSINLNGGTLKDASGNDSNITSLAVVDNDKYLVDTIRPTVTVTSSTHALISGQTATITFNFSEDPGTSFVWNGSSGDLLVSGGNLGALSTTGNPLTRTARLTPTSGVSAGTASVAIALNSYTDAAGNFGQEALSGVTDKSADISVNTSTTTVASVTLISATGIQNNLLNQGDVVSVAVNFTEAVFLNANVGTPSVDLTIGSTVVSALYVSGAGTAQLVFNYTILNSQTDANGIAINANSLKLNGKALTDTAGNTPTLNFAAAADNANYLVDTTAPSVVSISSSRSTFLSGETALITFTFSEDPGSTFTWNGSTGDVTLVNGTLSAISGAGLTRTATFLPTQGLTGGSASITVNNDLFTDNAGNLGTGNTLGTLVVNTSPATLMDVKITSAVGIQNNALNAGDVVTVTAHFSEAQTLNTTSGSPTVALQIGGSTVNATYASGAGTSDLLFNYTILAGQTDANGIAIDANPLALNGSTLKDPRTNTTTLSLPATADNSNFSVDTTAPFLSITSNVGQVKVGETANITFTFSEDPGNTFEWNGTTGDLTLSNGTLSAINGTGVTRTAVWTPSPQVNAGTAGIAVSAGAYQDAAGNNGSAGETPSITLDTLAPTISAIALTGSTGILNAYLNEGDTAIVSVTFNEVVNLNLTSGSPTLALLVGSSTVQASYVSGAGSNTLLFTTTLTVGQNDSDGIAIAQNALSLNGAVLTDGAGNTSTPNSAAVSSNNAFMVDTLSPSVSLAFNVASLKVGETATLTVTVNDKTGSSFSWNGTAGDLTVTGGTLSALSPFALIGPHYVSTATFTPTAGSTTAGVVSTASAVYTDLAGNSGQVGSSASVLIDTNAPTLTNLNITGASGILSNTLNAGDVVQMTATFSEAVFVNTSGGTPKMVLNVGGVNNSASYVSGSGTTDLLFNYTILAGDNDTNGLSYAANAIQLNGGTIKDSAGNSAVITSIARSDNAAYKVDTTAPTVTIASNMTQLLVGQTANITFTFSED
ncbi:MAG: beta strand repeat-containing protein, partial [Limnohabitans sp.]